MTADLHRTAAHGFAVALALATGVFALNTFVDLGADAVASWTYNGVVAGGAVLTLWRGVAVREERAPWLAVGVGLTSWFAGEIWWLLQPEDAVPPVPAAGDLLYLGTFPPLGIALVLLVRQRVGRLSRMLAVDGLIAAFAVAAVAAAFVLEPVLEHTTGDTATLVMTIAWPVCDIVLIGLLVEAAALSGWTLPRGWALLAAGFVSFAVTDSVYTAEAAEGAYEEGGLLDVGWLAASVLIGLAAWQPVPPPTEARDTGWRALVAPGAFGAVAVVTAAYVYGAHLNALAMALACAALVAVIVRMVATFRENLAILADARKEALTDALTGLGNRRRLLIDLDERLADGRRHVLVLCDLDGFKHYNDSFGHPAGDALLRRFATRLAWTVAGRGRAYRMGGDEFCVLLDDALGSDEATALVAGALAEHGTGFSVTASCGTVTLPDEARDAGEVLRLGDARMYERKRGGRATAEEQSVATLLRLMSERGRPVDDRGELAAAVAADLGLSPAECEDVRIAALLHDVGKLAVPDSIVDKPGPLDGEEWEFMCRHPLIGQRILAATPGLAGAGALVRASHERPDGCGYPDRLAGQEIPLAARIVAVWDAFDGMTSPRPYRRAMTTRAALAQLRDGAGSQFDARVVAAFEAALTGAQALAA